MITNWKILISAALLLVAQPGFADDKATATARLQSVDALTALDSPAVKPWHLKLNVQLFDDRGKPTEQGDIEEWWANPQQSLISYTFPSYTGKVLQTADGTFRTAHFGVPPMLVALLLDQVVHPMPRAADLEGTEPTLRKETVATLPLACIMLSQPLKDVPVQPLGLFPTYCLDESKDILRATYFLGSVAAVQNTVGKFQNLMIATNVTVNVGATKLAEARLTALAGLKPDATLFSKPEGFEPVGKMTLVSSEVMNDQALIKVPTVYPATAKSKHSDGAVVMRAIIGRDGHVHTLQLKSTPDADLALSALYAVRQWVYKPYLLNGEAVDVDTTITVRFQYRGK